MIRIPLSMHELSGNEFVDIPTDLIRQLKAMLALLKGAVTETIVPKLTLKRPLITLKK